MNNNNGGGSMIGYALIIVLQVITITLITLWITSSGQFCINNEAERFTEEQMNQIEQVIHNMDPIKRGNE